MTLAVPPRWRVGPELVQLFDRVRLRIPTLRSGEWANAIAALELATETYKGGRSQLPGAQDVLSLFLGGRICTSLAYLLEHSVSVDEQLKELQGGVGTGEHQAWHAESHLFVLAQLHCASARSTRRWPVVSVPKIKGVSTPDIAVDQIGLEVTIRPPSASIETDQDVLGRINAGIQHAQEKATGQYGRVVAYVDFGPLDVRKGGEVARRIAERRGFFEGPIAQMLARAPAVPAAILATTLFDFDPSRTDASPAFRSAVHLRSGSHPMPHPLSEMILDLFDRR